MRGHVDGAHCRLPREFGTQALETARPAIERRIEERKEEKPAEAPAEREDRPDRPADAEDKAEKEKPKQVRPAAQLIRAKRVGLESVSIVFTV